MLVHQRVSVAVVWQMLPTYAGQFVVFQPSKSNSIQWHSGLLSHRTQGEAKPCLEPRVALAEEHHDTMTGSKFWHLPSAARCHKACNSCSFFPVKVKGCKEYHVCIFFLHPFLLVSFMYFFVSQWAISYYISYYISYLFLGFFMVFP